jgi:hypothetical protein
VRATRDALRNRIDLRIAGAATFLRLPKLVDALEALPRDVEVQVRLEGLTYIDHACMDALANWEKQRIERGGRVSVEWDELMEKYTRRNNFRRVEAAAEAMR